jgi:predicted molibdopterin-dependent oxidoreductase YjgC
MHYRSVDDIFNEIVETVPVYKNIKENELTGRALQWPYSQNGVFDIEDGLARFKMPELKASEINEVLRTLT